MSTYMEPESKSIPIYYENKDLSKITQVTIGGNRYTVLNFSFLTMNDQHVLVVVYKNENNVVNVMPFDFEMVSMSSMEPDSMGGKKKKKSKK